MSSKKKWIKMKNRAIVITAVLLIISIGNYSRFISAGNTRAVEFLSIFAIGALTGILIFQVAKEIKERKK
jgi:uncharacterized membrane protein